MTASTDTASTDTSARSRRKREQIIAAAREVFTNEGYIGTSMDAVAAQAGASKRTVYHYFPDKEQLFAATVLDTVDRGYEYFRPRILALAETDDIENAIREQARATMRGLTDPELLKMRRLVIAEAERFPGIGREYYERSWVRTLELFADTLRTLTRRGLLAVEDPYRAAYIFTWLIASIPTNKVAFLGDAALDPPDELIAQADEAARVFLAAYTPATSRRSARPSPHDDRPARGA